MDMNANVLLRLVHDLQEQIMFLRVENAKLRASNESMRSDLTVLMQKKAEAA